MLGEGTTSKVYKCVSVTDPKYVVALKLIKADYLARGKDALREVEKEIKTLQSLSHYKIGMIIDHGYNGQVVKPSRREIDNLIYIVLEYLPGCILYNIVEKTGAMGEQSGRFCFEQMVDIVDYLHTTKEVVHRDLKPENMIMDDKLNIKLTDFGFATSNKIDQLRSYRGSKRYMAPEIKEKKKYDGRASDVFSLGVILFVLVKGIFPFREANESDYFYRLIVDKKHDEYWAEIFSKDMSEEFKDLIMKMISYEPSTRLTIQQIKNHPWMTKKYDMPAAKKHLKVLLSDD